MILRACVPFNPVNTLFSFMIGLFLTTVTEPPNLMIVACIPGWFLDEITFAKSISQRVSTCSNKVLNLFKSFC